MRIYFVNDTDGSLRRAAARELALRGVPCAEGVPGGEGLTLPLSGAGRWLMIAPRFENGALGRVESGAPGHNGFPALPEGYFDRVIAPGAQAAALAGRLRAGTVITYGLRSADTVTLSALQDTAMVCVQRALPTLDGQSLDPSELPAAHPADEDAELLLARAALLLSLGLPLPR